MRLALLALAAAASLVPPSAAEALSPSPRHGAPEAPAQGRRGKSRARGETTRARILLAGTWAEVRWTDGDTFRVLGGPHANRTARLQGVNALESFGPVHRIGTAGGRELLAVAKRAASVAAAASVRCELVGHEDAYRRLLVSCPEVEEALVRSGHAMVFAVDADPNRRLVQLQRDAQQARAGIWMGGAPPLVPTSIHSADERDLGAKGAYDRIADTRTGATEVRPHQRTYRPCEEVCVGAGAERACLTYVPYERRFKDRPGCLR